MSDADFGRGLADAGLPVWVMEMLVSREQNTRRGLTGAVTDAVPFLTGRMAEPLEHFLANESNRAALLGPAHAVE